MLLFSTVWRLKNSYFPCQSDSYETSRFLLAVVGLQGRLFYAYRLFSWLTASSMMF